MASGGEDVMGADQSRRRRLQVQSAVTAASPGSDRGLGNLGAMLECSKNVNANVCPVQVRTSGERGKS